MEASIPGLARDQDGAASIRRRPLATPAGESGSITITVRHPDATVFNLTGCQLLLTVQPRGQELDTPLISRQATISSPATGVGVFPLVVADTLELLGSYRYDVRLTDSGANQYQVAGPAPFLVTPSLGDPEQPVTVPEEQEPLGLGPQGPAGVRTIVSRTISQPTDGSLFTVTIPSSPFSDTNYAVVPQPVLTSDGFVTVGPRSQGKTSSSFQVQTDVELSNGTQLYFLLVPGS